MKTIAALLDFANHHSNATHGDIQKLCRAVIAYGFNSVFVNPCYIAYAREQLNGVGKVGTVISFPLGQELLATTLFSVQQATLARADELDMALNVADIKEARWDVLVQTMTRVIDEARSINPQIIIKCIPETGYLEPDEIKKMAELMVQAGVDFFKTNSGFGPRGARVEDVQLVRSAVGSAIKIKVAGGISTYQQARAFIDAGADRIGTSHAIEIVQEEPES